MYNFFVNNEQIINSEATITGADYNHIVKVLRFNCGQKIYISNKDNAKSYLAEIIAIDKNKVICKLISENESTENKVKVTIFQGIPKSDKMDFIVQKCTELGALSFYLVEMKNCVMKLNNEDKKIARWQNIAEASSKQSKRNVIPKVNGKITIDDVIVKLEEYDLSLVAYESEKKQSLKILLSFFLIMFQS